MKKELTVKVPARLHMGVWDMNKFGLGKRGGGGIGLPVGLYTTITGKISSQDVIEGESNLIATRFLESIKDILNIKDVYFEIQIERDYEMHVGLGSTGSVLVGIIQLVTELLELDFSEEQLIEIVLDVMKEEHDDIITESFETAVGPWACLKRDMVVVDTECKLVDVYKVDKSIKVLLVTPSKEGIASSIEDETVLLEGRGKELDRSAYELKRYLLSYLRNTDINDRKELSVLKIVDILKYVGSKRAEIEYQEKLHKGLYSELTKVGENNNCLVSGMSSIGPTFYYLDKEENVIKIRDELKSYNVNVKMVDVDYYDNNATV